MKLDPNFLHIGQKKGCLQVMKESFLGMQLVQPATKTDIGYCTMNRPVAGLGIKLCTHVDPTLCCLPQIVFISTAPHSTRHCHTHKLYRKLFKSVHTSNAQNSKPRPLPTDMPTISKMPLPAMAPTNRMPKKPICAHMPHA